MNESIKQRPTNISFTTVANANVVGNVNVLVVIVVVIVAVIVDCNVNVKQFQSAVAVALFLLQQQWLILHWVMFILC